MRLIEAVIASAAIHAGLLAMPTGKLSPNPSGENDLPPRPLRVELRGGSTASDTDAGTSGAMLLSSQTQESSQSGSDADHDGFGIPVPYYYSPREVSERAKPVREIDLEPPEMPVLPNGGRLILLLWINESGRVDRIETQSSQVVAAMESMIADQFRQAVFTPARLDGKPVKSRMKIEVVVKPPTAYVVPQPQPKPASAAEN